MHVKCTFCRPSYLVCNWKQTVTWFYFLYVPTSLLLFVEFSWRFWLSRANKRCKWILKLNRETCYLLYKRKPQSYIHYNNNNAICIYARMCALFIVWENLCRQAASGITNVSSLLQRQAFFLDVFYLFCILFGFSSSLLANTALQRIIRDVPLRSNAIYAPVTFISCNFSRFSQHTYVTFTTEMTPTFKHALHGTRKALQNKCKENVVTIRSCYCVLVCMLFPW